MAAREVEQNWPPTATAQETSKTWLQTNSLESKGLTLDQLLPTLGFKQSQGTVQSSGLHITSTYSDGLFTQHPDSKGNVYNICANETQMQLIENQLSDFITLLKARLQWLNTNSRLMLGALVHSRAVIIVDSTISDPSQLVSYINAIKLFIKEQISQIDKFNIIRCTGGLSCYNEGGLVDVTTKTIEAAIQWLEEGQPTSDVPLTNNLIEAMTRSITSEETDAVYLMTQGNSALRSLPQLQDLLETSQVPVNIGVYICNDNSAVEEYKELCQSSHGRLHLYNPKAPLYPVAESDPSSRPSSAQSSTSSTSNTSKTRPLPLPREDVLFIWEELERGRDTLAEIQAIKLERQSIRGTGQDKMSYLPSNPSKEEYMSSVQWLEIHGLKANSLMFSDLVNKLAFQHCEGLLRLSASPDHTHNNEDIQVVNYDKLVGAQYCRGFVHLRWGSDKIIHAHLDERTFQNYCSKVLQVISKCENRSEWLEKGSRELFGTVLEQNIVICIDKSSSLKSRLTLVKKKLRQLLHEQLVHKTSFTILAFSSDVIAWREHLVPITPQNIAAAQEWMEGLVASGGTDTLGVLRQGLGISGAEALYLLTDGRPDQSSDVILAHLQQWRQIPVHTISFNCADTKANTFLARLAAVTDGRYHYYSEDISNPDGPVSHQSDDLQLLTDEITLANDQLIRAEQLREECAKLRQKGKGTSSCSTTPQRKKQSRKQSHDKLSLSKWFKKNTLSKRHLTLMDALGPTSVPHDPVHVPILAKHVRGKVFDNTLTTAHISGKGRVTLINPLGIDLLSYEEKLDQYITECEQRLEREVMVYAKVETVREELGLGEEDILTYRENRDVLRQHLKKIECDNILKDVNVVEVEIRKAQAFKKQAIALREESSKRQQKASLNESPSKVSTPSHCSSISESSGINLSDLDKPTFKEKPKSIKKSGHVIRRGQQVIGPSPKDGLLYPGIVSDLPHRDTCEVLLSTGDSVTIATKLLLPIGGSAPCPSLRPGDYALVRTRIKLIKGDLYLPCVVRALPDNPRIGNARFSVSIFGGRVVTCSRRAIVKIGRDQYRMSCEQLTNWLRQHNGTFDMPIQSPQLSSTPNRGTTPTSPRLQRETTPQSPHLQPIFIPSSTTIDYAEPHVYSPGVSKPHLLSPGPTDPPINPVYHGPVMLDRGTSPILLCDTGINTDPITESKGTITDPVKRDVATVTEWEEFELEEKERQEKLQERKKDNEDQTEVVLEENTPHLSEEEDDHHDSNSCMSQDLTIGMLESTHISGPSEPVPGEQVLSRWMDDGWYYRGIVINKHDDTHWTLQDANGDCEICPRDDIITDQDDASMIIKIGDPVISLHPSYPHSYAPGHVTGVLADGLNMMIELYDKVQGVLPRHEIYSTNEDKYQEIVQFILSQEQAWVGRAVIAQREETGLFHPGVVIKQLKSSQQYLIRWSDNSTQLQDITHMFGELTRRRPLYIGDYVIGLPESGHSKGVCHPGQIIGVQGTKLIIRFHDNKCHLASSEHCFWISDTYYQNSTDIISSIQQSYTNTEQLFQIGTDTLQSQTSTYPQQSQTDTDPQQTCSDQQSNTDDTHPQIDTSSVSD